MRVREFIQVPFGLIGAYSGAWIFVHGLSWMPESVPVWLHETSFPVGGGGVLPLMGLAWLASAVFGLFLFVFIWRKVAGLPRQPRKVH
jgi:hypothetical protein